MTRFAVVAGSVAQMAAESGQSIAEAFLHVALVAIVDVSGSMGTRDSRAGASRYEVACEELGALQADYPGQVALVAFADSTRFVPGGIPPLLGGGTNLADALRFARKADGSGARFCVISDGWPDDPEGALAVARTYESSISTIFVGAEHDRAGQEFLRRLASAAGGTYQPDHRVSLLAKKLRRLIGAASEEGIKSADGASSADGTGSNERSDASGAGEASKAAGSKESAEVASR